MSAFGTDVAVWSSGLRAQDIPTAVMAKAQLHILDTIGCAFASTGSDADAAVKRILSRQPASTSPVFGSGATTPEAAALVNGMLMHALDFDDTHQASYMHVSAPLVAALLAASDGSELGDEFVTAYVAGAEVSIRLGMASDQRMHLRGFHPTSIFGTIGATAAVAKMRRCDRATTISAIGIAASLGSGVMAYLNDGTDTKTVHPGWAAQSALWAVTLAQAGVSGPASAIDGPKGLLATHLDDFDSLQVESLGSVWETLNIAIKPYPVCHSAQGGLGALDEAMRQNDLEADRVDSLHVEVPTDVVVGMVLEPIEAKRAPRNFYEARFSLPWLLGTLLTRKEVTLATLEDPTVLSDPAIARLASSTTYERSDLGPDHDLGARLSIRFADGSESAHFLPIPVGLPGNDLSAAEVMHKFMNNMTFGNHDEIATQLAEVLVDLRHRRLAELLALLHEHGPSPREHEGE